ncbi:MAG TPA: enoyl-CoA hydratase-related protein [Sphingomicrobium sp.]|jgi:enoyl-CoA hydratase/carnithine racemase
MSEHVKVEQQGPVLSVTLARPERRNALTVAMYAALADAVQQASGNPDIRLIAFRGEGADFAAGNDLVDFLNAAPRIDEEIPVWRFLRALADCETPLLASVHGNCVGIGTTMLLHCDLVVAEEGARFSLPFVDLALVPEAASSLLIPRLAGRRRAARYLLLAEPFGVDEAIEIGLVSHRAAAGELAATTEDVVSRLMSKPAEALRQTQHLLRTGARDEILERMRLESGLFAERLASAEVKQAISAFFEKRRPA